MNLNSAQNNPEIIDNRQKFTVSIRRSNNEKIIGEFRSMLRNNMEDICIKQLNNFPLVFKAAEEGNWKQLQNLIQLHMIGLTQSQIKSVLTLSINNINAQSLIVLSKICTHEEINNIIDDQSIQCIVNAAVIFNNIKTQEMVNTMNQMYSILGRIHPRLNSEQLLEISELINTQSNMILSKQLIHLYYLMRKQFSTIIKNYTLNRLIQEKFILQQSSNIIMRVSQIITATIKYKQYSDSQFMLILNKIAQVIQLQDSYHEDIVFNTFCNLYQLVTTLTKHQKKRIISHPIFNILLNLSQNYENKNKCIKVLCGIIKSLDQTHLSVLTQREQLWLVTSIFIDNLNSYDHALILNILQAVKHLCELGYQPLLINNGIINILNKLQNTIYEAIYKQVITIIDTYFQAEFD